MTSFNIAIVNKTASSETALNINLSVEVLNIIVSRYDHNTLYENGKQD